MSSVNSQATEKIRTGLKAYKGNRYGEALKDFAANQLIFFCDQNEEFSQAVLDGGEFKACMDSLCKGLGGYISDLDVAKRAAGFYFPGCEIRMTMTIYTSAFEMQDAEVGEEAVTEGGGIVLNLEDFL